MSGEVYIGTEGDIVTARRAIRDAAIQLNFVQTDVTRIVTAASELARNTFKYAGSGTMYWRPVERQDCQGIEIQFLDRGPGIQDISLAMQEGYSTSGGLGMGLPGARRLVDQLDIQSVVGQGTTITIWKWSKKPIR